MCFSRKDIFDDFVPIKQSLKALRLKVPAKVQVLPDGGFGGRVVEAKELKYPVSNNAWL